MNKIQIIAALIAIPCWAHMIKQAWSTRHAGPAHIRLLEAKAEYSRKLRTLAKARKTVWEGEWTPEMRRLQDRLDELEEEAYDAYAAARDHFIAAATPKPTRLGWRRDHARAAG